MSRFTAACLLVIFACLFALILVLSAARGEARHYSLPGAELVPLYDATVIQRFRLHDDQITIYQTGKLYFAVTDKGGVTQMSEADVYQTFDGAL